MAFATLTNSRCAVHYHSAKARNGDLSLFNQLQESEIWTSQRISQTLCLTQGGERHASDIKKANSHVVVDDSTGKVRLYVPEQEKEREICYLRQVPKKLATFLGIKDAAAAKIIGDILTSSSDRNSVV